MGVAATVRQTRNGGSDHIADGKDEGPRILGQPDGGQSVGSLTGLGNCYHNIILVYDRLAVTELAAVFHLDRNTGELLNAVHGNQSGMP